MLNELTILIITCFCITLAIIITYIINNRINMKNSLDNIKLINGALNYTQRSISFSKDFLSFIDTLIKDTTLLMFREFVDTHDLERVTISNVTPLLSDISSTVASSISNLEGLSIYSIINNEFLCYYIPTTTSYYLKDVLEKYISSSNSEN